MQHRLTHFLKAVLPLCATLSCLMTSGVQAAFIGSLHIQFQAAGETGSYDVVIPGNADAYSWALPSAVEIHSDKNPGIAIATLQGLNFHLDGDPGVSLGFSVQAGAAPTNITVVSSFVSFSAITDPFGFATAAVTVTDTDSNGASATPPGRLTYQYQAVYNGGVSFPSTAFAHLISTVAAGADSSALGSGRFPAAGTVLIPGSVTSIQSAFDFLLSANDLASGTSRFNITPEPSSVVLAALGFIGLVAWGWRRGRK
jgi:hypothetical protein